MIAATFFSVLLVPSFFVVFQTLAELRRAREPEPQVPSSMTVCDSAARGLRL